MARKIGKGIRKMKAVIAGEETEEILKKFGERIEKFRVMVEQTERLTDKCALEEPSRSAKLNVQHYGTIKAAAIQLYSAFGQACTKHTEHHGYIGLQPTHGHTNRIKFVLAFRSRSHQGLITSTRVARDDALWLNIESEVQEITNIAQSNGILNSLQASAKRVRESEPTELAAVPNQRGMPKKEQKKQKFRNKVWFKGHATNCPRTAINTALMASAAISTDALINFCRESNFCTKMMTISNQPQHPVGQCIGYLETTSTSKHLVYMHTWMNEATRSKDSDNIMALSQILMEMPEEGFPNGPLTIFHICKQLAIALLQFYQTPWLGDSWSSDDIMLPTSQRDSLRLSSKPEDDTEQDAIREPFANVSIREDAVIHLQLTARHLSLIKNRTMFNLGKMFLELAYLKPFQALKIAEDGGSSGAAEEEDFAAANRLLCSVSAKVGLNFEEIVRKCIHCDFAQGHDLGSERLQAAFYQYVIQELERCEKKAHQSFLLT
jgi:hypothetical protein